ncbi:hypothetical protein BDP81DRAFT_52796 [Colletotrichum phormii]|uniref:Uncharacterized protein n=1 Tax=Colletotrichum phormii TaxID=359342 RepID=A0AAI9ZMN4_9PEZI|nr:uncharacterized protein BDP81DRAFT_52796 [Colletotrichum phormii]KAK1634768.1 hypothetical protein BDP81DRAFT_52796 [Colletotrichum phormii]
MDWARGIDKKTDAFLAGLLGGWEPSSSASRGPRIIGRTTHLFPLLYSRPSALCSLFAFPTSSVLPSSQLLDLISSQALSQPLQIWAWRFDKSFADQASFCCQRPLPLAVEALRIYPQRSFLVTLQGHLPVVLVGWAAQALALETTGAITSPKLPALLLFEVIGKQCLALAHSIGPYR